MLKKRGLAKVHTQSKLKESEESKLKKAESAMYFNGNSERYHQIYKAAQKAKKKEIREAIKPQIQDNSWRFFSYHWFRLNYLISDFKKFGLLKSEKDKIIKETAFHLLAIIEDVEESNFFDRDEINYALDVCFRLIKNKLIEQNSHIFSLFIKITSVIKDFLATEDNDILLKKYLIFAAELNKIKPNVVPYQVQRKVVAANLEKVKAFPDDDLIYIMSDDFLEQDKDFFIRLLQKIDFNRINIRQEFSCEQIDIILQYFPLDDKHTEAFEKFILNHKKTISIGHKQNLADRLSCYSQKFCKKYKDILEKYTISLPSPSSSEDRLGDKESLNKSIADILEKYFDGEMKRLGTYMTKFFNKGAQDKYDLFEKLYQRVRDLQKHQEGNEDVKLQLIIKEAAIVAHHKRYSKCNRVANLCFFNRFKAAQESTSWQAWRSLDIPGGFFESVFFESYRDQERYFLTDQEKIQDYNSYRKMQLKK